MILHGGILTRVRVRVRVGIGRPEPGGDATEYVLSGFDAEQTEQLDEVVSLAAEEAGATAIGGLDMLVCQGATGFEMWTGVEAPVAMMKEAAARALGL